MPGFGHPTFAPTSKKLPYVERLRREHMKSGNCKLCSAFADPLEGHHESYKPARKIYICHKCHHKAHFTPWLLPDEHKRKLLIVRGGGRMDLAGRELEERVKDYVAPRRG